MKRASFIDIGTNTALLLIADLDPVNNSIIPVLHRQTIVRLGKNVDEQKIIDHVAMQRLIQCLLDFKELSKEHKAERIVAAGTSALRDAKNRMEIIDEVVMASGIVIKTLSGEEEAALTFTGAIAGMENAPERFTVIDIGGGSTEISMGDMACLDQSVSLDIGSVRLTERLFSDQPPSETEFYAAKEEIDRMFTGNLEPFFAGREHVFGVAGTLTTIAKLVSGQKEFDPAKIHNYPLHYNQVRQLLEELKSLTIEQIIGRGVPEGRADVITMGTLILHQFMRLLGVQEITVSIQGLRYGMALKELQQLQGENSNIL
ncbi:Ppx/GppA phosphatase family protein [Prosthecochloris sp. SCSIO W1103]|uniref:Ppx/GppA phosphatase family protein n=1 Tax=Prosthecochloris sp. SCSIO W1103 TaxID=2992244 RepID=UPI00223D5F16|nr:Ppx/GppA phosphatase family protein [Prosthecochloris sp. SCSIO W1103]UZJ37551.1 Ppx/GppA family phosphatase [Prosthecochloris sp. SCSIO W1103]